MRYFFTSFQFSYMFNSFLLYVYFFQIHVQCYSHTFTSIPIFTSLYYMFTSIHMYANIYLGICSPNLYIASHSDISLSRIVQHYMIFCFQKWTLKSHPNSPYDHKSVTWNEISRIYLLKELATEHNLGQRFKKNHTRWTLSTKQPLTKQLSKQPGSPFNPGHNYSEANRITMSQMSITSIH